MMRGIKGYLRGFSSVSSRRTWQARLRQLCLLAAILLAQHYIPRLLMSRWRVPLQEQAEEEQINSSSHMSLAELADLSVLSQEEEPALAPEGSDYTAEMYMEDFRNQPHPVTGSLTSGKYAEAWECGNVPTKHPLLASHRIGPLESDLVELVSSTWIFRYNDYLKYSHMAMLEHWGSILVAAWQAAPAPRNLLTKSDGSKEIVVEGLPDQRLLYSVSRDLGKTWEMPYGIQLMDSVPQAERGAVWSPVLHAARDGKLWLFYSQSRVCKKSRDREVTWAPGGDIKAVTLKNLKSLSVGLFDSSDVPSWSVPRVVLSQSDGDLLPKVVANKMIVLSSGEWVLPFWRERPDVEMYSCMKGVADEPSSGVLISEDEGQSWTAHGVLHDTRSPLLEGTVVELASKDILMLLRSSTGCMWRSMSKDQGRTWSEPEPTRLPNPNSKVHMIRLQNSSHLVLAFNNHKKFGTHLPTAEAGEGTQCRACRTALSLAISTNDGISWRVVASVDMDLTPGIRIHYPTLQQVDDTLLVTYSKFYLYRDPGEWSSDQGIRVASFNISKLLSTLAQDQVLRSIPSRGALLRMVDHFIEKLTPAEEAFIQTKGFRGTSAKKSERRWRWLAAALSNRYDLEHLGGLQWLVKKSNFAQYASGRVWSPERMQTAHANMSAATLRQADIAPTDIE
eukprot:CAMPEP_0117657606 /NCGR_PEP_ID=MMETSP0804-20121206/5421_1 /TAXON_ID=1074897 /ORGANISM="Tetraselmis astigmatica, Strain CCMP880" /LENGTH=674 /DNA_ID=CAMNT_0005464073 /DNA_START=533 /DNA_END=2557 /DNA_ORIENTATION=-